ncbi:MAG: hypothetical protein MJZ19_09695 [Paludibacteraceae bacterium]|nr:hypothetical protein [Paludibacteraceae bacterium]
MGIVLETKKAIARVLIKIMSIIPDKPYLQLMYRYKMKKFFSWEHPETFTEKLQWLKLYYKDPILTTMVDKYAVKDYVTQKCGPGHVIPLLGVWNTPEEIDFDKLPNQFVLKTTHGGGGCGVVICRDKATFDKEAAFKKLHKSLKTDLFVQGREYPYRDVPRRIIAEEYAVDESGVELKDYKIFCFDGVVKMIKVDFDRFISHHANYFTPEWELMDFGEDASSSPVWDKDLPRPKNLELMLEIAQTLSKGLPFVRIDTYNVNGTVYVGEITFFPASGFDAYKPVEWNNIIGDWLTLPDCKI